MFKKITKSTFLFSIILGLYGCASIVNGPKQAVDFTSQPAGAKIIIDGKDYGTTPNSVSLRRKGRLAGEASNKVEYNVRIELAGYYPYDVKVKRKLNGWIFGNIVFGGLIGIIIDVSNGSMYRLSPDQVVAQLSRSTAAVSNKNDDRLQISVVLKADPSWEKIGTLEKAN
jgi:hypothetical protein